MLKVLLIDDDDDIRFGLNRVLSRCGHIVEEVDSGVAALKALGEASFDLVFCDRRFPIGPSGEETLKTIVEQYPNTEVVMMSCAMDLTDKQQLKALGAAEAVEKPLMKAECLQLLESIFPASEKAA